MCIKRNDAVQKHRGDNNAFYISISTLSKKNNCDKNTVEKYLDVLEELKLLTIKKGKFSDRKANEYYLNDKWISVFENMLTSSDDSNIIEDGVNISISNDDEFDPDFDY